MSEALRAGDKVAVHINGKWEKGRSGSGILVTNIEKGCVTLEQPEVLVSPTTSVRRVARMLRNGKHQQITTNKRRRYASAQEGGAKNLKVC